MPASLIRTRNGTAGDETRVLFVTTSHTEIVRRLDQRAVVRFYDVADGSVLRDGAEHRGDQS
jgi:hypothetical protein